MKKFFRHFMLFSSLLLVSNVIEAQQYFVIENSRSLKNFKYQVGDDIVIVPRPGDFTFSGKITQITDSSIFIDHFTEIKVHNIQAVVRSSKFIKKISGLFFIRGGLVYLGVVGINSAINHENPIIDKQTAIISATMVAIGFALKPFIKRKYDVDNGWRIKILDFDRINEPGLYSY